MPPETSQSAPNPIAPSTVRGPNWLLFATIGLGVLLVVFIITTVAFANSASTYKSGYDSAKQQGFKDGQSAQSKADAAQIQDIKESPFSTYTAPDIFGGFKLKYPKNWSVYVQADSSADGQITVTLNPDAVVAGQNGAMGVYAAQVQLIQALYSDQQATYQNNQDKLKSSDIIVSGIKGSRYDGKFDNTNEGSVVILPVRDKTMVISTTNTAYLSEFNQILGQARISP